MKIRSVERIKVIEPVFSRDASIAETIQRFIGQSETAVDAALYSFSSEDLLRSLFEARNRGIGVRLVTDWSKYDQNGWMRKLLADTRVPLKLLGGRNGSSSKMHHKFMILDNAIVLTGSYNWTPASETHNYENIVVIREPSSVLDYRCEFKRLWDEGIASPR